MNKNLLPLWIALQNHVSPPDALIKAELLAANVTILVKELDGTIKFQTITIPMKEEK